MSCGSIIHHGPGHQSTSECQVEGPHHVHVHRRSYAADFEWVGDEAFTGFFDEIIEVTDEDWDRDARAGE